MGPYRVLVPDARHQCSAVSRVDSVGLLRVRHHLQVWGRVSDLPDLICKILQGWPFAVKVKLARDWRLQMLQRVASFSGPFLLLCAFFSGPSINSNDNLGIDF